MGNDDILEKRRISNLATLNKIRGASFLPNKSSAQRLRYSCPASTKIKSALRKASAGES